MRYYQLTEDIKLSNNLYNLARQIAVALQEKAKELINKNVPYNEQQLEFDISDIKSSISNLFKDVKIRTMFIRNKTLKGYFSRETKTIVLNSSILNIPYDLGNVISCLIHEMRHAIDYFKSSDRAFTRFIPKKDFKSVNTTHGHSEQFINYLRKPTEIAARIEQALHELKNIYEYYFHRNPIKITSDRILYDINEKANKHSLSARYIGEDNFLNFKKRAASYIIDLISSLKVCTNNFSIFGVKISNGFGYTKMGDMSCKLKVIESSIDRTTIPEQQLVLITLRIEHSYDLLDKNATFNIKYSSLNNVARIVSSSDRSFFNLMQHNNMLEFRSFKELFNNINNIIEKETTDDEEGYEYVNNDIEDFMISNFN